MTDFSDYVAELARRPETHLPQVDAKNAGLQVKRGLRGLKDLRPSQAGWRVGGVADEVAEVVSEAE